MPDQTDPLSLLMQAGQQAQPQGSNPLQALLGSPTLSNQQVMQALMAQQLAQRNQQMMQSPDVQTRAYGLASGGFLPMIQAIGQAPVIQRQQAMQNQKQLFDNLKALIGMQKDQVNMGLMSAQTETEKGKPARLQAQLGINQQNANTNETKALSTAQLQGAQTVTELGKPGREQQKIGISQGNLDVNRGKLDVDQFKAGVDAAFKQAEIKFKAMGLLNDQVKTMLESQKNDMLAQAQVQKQYSDKLRAAEVALKISEAAQKDPELQASISTLKGMQPGTDRDNMLKALLPKLEKTLGFKITDDRGVIESLLNWMGLVNSPNQAGQKLPAGPQSNPPGLPGMPQPPPDYQPQSLTGLLMGGGGGIPGPQATQGPSGPQSGPIPGLGPIQGGVPAGTAQGQVIGGSVVGPGWPTPNPANVGPTPTPGGAPLSYGPAPGYQGVPAVTPGRYKTVAAQLPTPTAQSEDDILKNVLGE